MIYYLLSAAATEVPGPGFISLLGMGTVFVSLTLIYLIMALMGRLLSLKDAKTHPAASAPSPSAAEGVTEMDVFEDNVKYDSAQSNIQPQVIAAIGIALAKHRKAKTAAGAETPAGPGISPWKLAGRIYGRRG